MKCSDARPLLDLLLDGALDTKDSALVLDHLKECGDCQLEWNDIEQVHHTFQEVKNQHELPAGFQDKIRAKLRIEESQQQWKFLGQYGRTGPLAAIAATVVLIGLMLFPLIQHIGPTPPAVQEAYADALVGALSSPDSTVEPVIDRSKLDEKVGYKLRHVRLPGWQMSGAGVYKVRTSLPIARFDFTKADQRLSCYQAPQGMILASAGKENVAGKQVVFGNHGNFQYALFSQNGRDYLFVTQLPRQVLEDIVRGA